MSAKISSAEEKALRTAAAVHQGCIDKINDALVAGGCEPTVPGIMSTTHQITSGVIAKTGGFFSNLGKNIKESYEETKKAGEQRIARQEVDRQVEEQMKALKDQMHAKLGV